MNLITYETIRAAHRAEMDEQLQSLPKNFFEDVKNWLASKETQKDIESLLEVGNTKKILDDIINRRQRKIVLAALRTVRGNLPPTNLTEDERIFFDEIVKILKFFKENIKEKLMKYEIEEKIEEVKKDIQELKKEDKINIKILTDLPRFVGIDDEYYGPFNRNDSIQMPKNVADLLVSRRVAEKV